MSLGNTIIRGAAAIALEKSIEAARAALVGNAVQEEAEEINKKVTTILDEKDKNHEVVSAQKVADEVIVKWDQSSQERLNNKPEVFTFEDFEKLENGEDFHLFLQEVPGYFLVDALIGASPVLREKFLRNMSPRAQGMIREDIEERKTKIKKIDIENAQKALIDVASRFYNLNPDVVITPYEHWKLADLSDVDIQTITSKLDSVTLIRALKSATPEVRTKMLSSISQEAAQEIRNEIKAHPAAQELIRKAHEDIFHKGIALWIIKDTELECAIADMSNEEIELLLSYVDMEDFRIACLGFTNETIGQITSSMPPRAAKSLNSTISWLRQEHVSRNAIYTAQRRVFDVLKKIQGK